MCSFNLQAPVGCSGANCTESNADTGVTSQDYTKKPSVKQKKKKKEKKVGNFEFGPTVTIVQCVLCIEEQRGATSLAS